MPTSRCTSDRGGESPDGAGRSGPAVAPQAPARRIVPIASAPPPAGDSPFGDCAAAEPFALQVLGDAMSPEFDDGDIIIVEPEGLARDGSFVVARSGDEWTLRQLLRNAEGWSLAALNPAYPPTPIADLSPVRGVVIQKSKPGRRRSIKRYVD